MPTLAPDPTPHTATPTAMALLSRPLNTLMTTAAIVLAGITAAPMARAQEFGQQPIDPNLAVAIASPVRDGAFYNLMILEQIPNRQQCWQEQGQGDGNGPVAIDPLLLNFDFTGACDRKTDGNGYSVRVNGQDLGVQYRLEVSARQNDLVLFARPTRDRSAPPIEIGRTHGRTNGFLKIQLNPGWQMAHRLYNGQPTGHIYLTHDAPLDVRYAEGTAPALSQATTTPPPPSTPAQTSPLPTPAQTSPLPTPPPPSSTTPSGNYYRVIVPITSGSTLDQVRAIEPQAFRTTVNGQSVVQVGLFREQQRADEIYNALVAANLPAKIVGASAPAVASTPVVPTIPQGSVVVVLDPGHGGQDPGAVGIGGLTDKQVALTIATRVQQQLQAAGITVLMTRSTDVFVDLDARAQFANRAHADAFVSIHGNAINMSRPDINGLETYYYSSGERLARSIHASVLRNTDMSDRGVRTARYYVLVNTTMPSVLVETGFLTGSVDAARFRDPAAVNRIADGIARGILNYLGR